MALYRHRHEGVDAEYRQRIWQILAERIFQPYVRDTDTVLDLGTGRGEFINAIRAGVKIAVDLNPESKAHVGDAAFEIASATDLSAIDDGTVDVVFSSNLLEHLPDKGAVLTALRECRRVLRPGGTIIIVMPNVRYLPGRYWDYFDHLTPLTHLSLAEGLGLAGFRINRIVPRFVPYAVNSKRLPRSTLALRLYLRMPFVWPLFGKQMLVVGRTPR